MECLIERHKHDWSSAQVRRDLDFYLVDDCFIDEKFIERCQKAVRREFEDEIRHPCEFREAGAPWFEDTRELLRLRGYIIAASSERRLYELRIDESPLSVMEAIGQIRLFDGVMPDDNWGVKDADIEIEDSTCSNSIREENRESPMWSMYVWTYHNAQNKNVSDTTGVWSTGESICCIDFPLNRPPKVLEPEKILAASSESKSGTVLTPAAKRLDEFLAKIGKICGAEDLYDKLALAEIESFIDFSKSPGPEKEPRPKDLPYADKVPVEPPAKIARLSEPFPYPIGEEQHVDSAEFMRRRAETLAELREDDLEPLRDRQKRVEGLAIKSADDFCEALKAAAQKRSERDFVLIEKQVCYMIDLYHGLMPSAAMLLFNKIAKFDSLRRKSYRYLSQSAMVRMRKRLAEKSAGPMTAIPAKPGAQNLSTGAKAQSTTKPSCRTAKGRSWAQRPSVIYSGRSPG